MDTTEAEKIVQKAAESLGEHFDAVQIMVSWNEEGMTKMFKSGCGNWYARQGMAHEFINADVAQDAAIQIAKKLRPEE